MTKLTATDYRKAIELFSKIKEIETSGTAHSRKRVITYLAIYLKNQEPYGFNHGLKTSIDIVENGNHK
jgi:hypothetical protein